MLTNIQRRNLIIKRISRINRIPEDKLKELEDYVSKLEQEVPPKHRTLSFAGAWQDLDKSVMDDFTENLIHNRQKNKRRIDE